MSIWLSLATKLDREELKRLYRYEPIRPSDERFYHLDSLFELPEANLYAELTELSKEVDGIPTSSRQLFDDVRAAIEGVHRVGTLESWIPFSTSEITSTVGSSPPSGGPPGARP